MRADGLDEAKRLLGDVGVEMQAAFVSVLEVVEMTLNSELNVTARDDVAAQNRVAVAADACRMVSRCHAGDVDSEQFPLDRSGKAVAMRHLLLAVLLVAMTGCGSDTKPEQTAANNRGVSQ